jgi:amino acid transporter
MGILKNDGGLVIITRSIANLASFYRTFTLPKVIDHSWKSGVGATIGAGVYILIGTVAREQAGPALVLSLFIAGIAAALSALCYAELACRCPSAGSAYHYTYICIGEGWVTFCLFWNKNLGVMVNGTTHDSWKK